MARPPVIPCRHTIVQIPTPTPTHTRPTSIPTPPIHTHTDTHPATAHPPTAPLPTEHRPPQTSRGTISCSTDSRTCRLERACVVFLSSPVHPHCPDKC